ncbi:MAG: crossover junction endodeoxyribonuclease RuvC [Candidatus Krumholzibacteriota bacterium]|nr:crossover junction endodeoxyribonuclease RuvC [Candidatus Krumholzibacteriota bacterium]
MPITVGIDPGSYVTGYGLLEKRGREIVCLGSGIIRVKRKTPRPERLLMVKNGLDKILRKFDPDDVAVEGIFMSRNVKSVFSLAEVRGVILLSAVQAGKNIFEYSPREVKCGVVGTGAATKRQVAAMVDKLLKLKHKPETADETDAIAIAFCHILRISSKLGGLI